MMTASDRTASCATATAARTRATATIRACASPWDAESLIYLYGVTRATMPVWPVYIVRDHPAELSFSVAVDAPYMPVMSNFKPDPNSLEARRAYITVLTQQRLHQQGFRERVLRAYREQCAICRLRHNELLDAARHPPRQPSEG